MAKPIIADSPHPVPVPESELEHVSGIAARVLRGQQLYQEHADDIRFEDGVWLVPSESNGTSVYEVTLGRRGESCECADFEHRGTSCKHIVAATIRRSKTRQCVACGKRFPHKHIVEVHEDHDSLTFYPGDPVCAGCALKHGLL